MKKTVSINLNGLIFNIDEDAYALLSSYIEQLKKFYGVQSDGEEIIQDIEARIVQQNFDREMTKVLTQWLQFLGTGRVLKAKNDSTRPVIDRTAIAICGDVIIKDSLFHVVLDEIFHHHLFDNIGQKISSANRLQGMNS